MSNQRYQICTNCVMDTSDPEIRFDENGRCDFCDNYYNSILPSWHPDESGNKELQAIVDKIKKDGRNKPYDCIIGLSGGVDSSYLTYIAKEKLGLRPLVLLVDTGWNVNASNENVGKLIKRLGVDLYTVVVDWEEMKDLQLAFFKSQVPYQDTPQDHAIFAGLYNYAAENGFKYVLTGANYSTEGVKPPYEWTYLNDIRMIKDIHKKFGKRPLRTFPLCGMFKYRVYYRYFKGVKVFRLLNMVPYEKVQATSELEKRFGWQQYGNKHYDNIFTRFFEGYWLPKKFGYDKRRCYLSTLVLTGQMTRKEALDILEEPPYEEALAMQDMEFISNKLDITTEEFLEMMQGPNKTFRDYKNIEKLLKSAIRFAMRVGIEKRNFR
ncbi:MAG: N-acetyl sugar amidotransferase [Syntrophomonas sp.]